MKAGNGTEYEDSAEGTLGISSPRNSMERLGESFARRQNHIDLYSGTFDTAARVSADDGSMPPADTETSSSAEVSDDCTTQGLERRKSLEEIENESGSENGRYFYSFLGTGGA